MRISNSVQHAEAKPLDSFNGGCFVTRSNGIRVHCEVLSIQLLQCQALGLWHLLHVTVTATVTVTTNIQCIRNQLKHQHQLKQCAVQKLYASTGGESTCWWN